MRSVCRWSLELALAMLCAAGVLLVAPSTSWAQSSGSTNDAAGAGSASPVASGPATEVANSHGPVPTDEAITAEVEAQESAHRRPGRAIVATTVGLVPGGLLTIGAGAISLFAMCGLRADVHNEGPAGLGCLWSLTAGSAIGGLVGATLGVTVTSMLMRGHGTPTMAFLGSLLGTFAQTAVSAGLIAAGGQEDETFLMIQLGLGLLPAIGATILYEVSSGEWEHAQDRAVRRNQAFRMSPSVMMVSGLTTQVGTVVPALTVTTF